MRGAWRSLVGLLLSWYKPNPQCRIWHVVCLRPFQLLQQNTTDWVTCEQQNLSLVVSRGWKSKPKTPARSRGVRPTSWFIDSHLLAMSPHGGRSQGALWGLFHKGTNPIHEVSTLMTQSAPKSPKTLPLGIRFQHMNFGETHTFSLQHRRSLIMVKQHRTHFTENRAQWSFGSHRTRIHNSAALFLFVQKYVI